MKYLSALFIALCSFVAINNANAQYVYDRAGKPINTVDYTNIEGSPYLVDNWSKGTVKLAGGKTYNDMQLKYNLVNDELYFKTQAGDALTFVDPVEEFTITYTDNDATVTKHYRRGYKNINRTTPNSYFEVISDGSLQLIKRLTKAVMETQEFNSATKTKSFHENTVYYLVTGEKAIQVKNDKKSILANLPDKQQQMQDYVKANKIDFKSDSDLAKLINYYNSI